MCIRSPPSLTETGLGWDGEFLAPLIARIPNDGRLFHSNVWVFWLVGWGFNCCRFSRMSTIYNEVLARLGFMTLNLARLSLSPKFGTCVNVNPCENVHLLYFLSCKSVFIRWNTEKRVEKTTRAQRSILTNFEVSFICSLFQAFK